MANHKSAIKRHRQSLKRRARNRAVKTRIKNVVKAVRQAVEEKDKTQAIEKLRTATSVIGKASQKGILHWKTAARKVSKLTKLVNSIE
ncbi:SSU ribosomal protein S20P [Desulfonauticus submarinus]|uniref:Small ribosomal subunit protein bS20 n=1 Tax=Desulfonauticus submarinus TaxID=206665 RepID=A0A1H0A5V1_9BACT|nr:30S ribosomal protein S20 [Desulfonauticus submarinus]SDN28116.1 SSU ribosomal protein S20P [Desulfonauticus submarinus]